MKQYLEWAESEGRGTRELLAELLHEHDRIVQNMKSRDIDT